MLSFFLHKAVETTKIESTASFSLFYKFVYLLVSVIGRNSNRTNGYYNTKQGKRLIKYKKSEIVMDNGKILSLSRSDSKKGIDVKKE